MDNPKRFTTSQRELYEFVSRLNREKADTFTEADAWLDTNPTTGQRKYFQSGPKTLERQVTFAAHKLLVEPPVFDAMDPEDRTLWARRVLRVAWIMTDTADLAATKLRWLRRWAWGKDPLPDFFGNGPSPRMGLRCTLFDTYAATWDRLASESLRVLGERAPQPEAGVATMPKASADNAPRQETVVLWEGALHTPYNTALARTRSAYLEAHGNVTAAREALAEGERKISRSTIYNHLTKLDQETPGWRDSVMLSNPVGQMDGLHKTRTRKKTRDKAR